MDAIAEALREALGLEAQGPAVAEPDTDWGEYEPVAAAAPPPYAPGAGQPRPAAAVPRYAAAPPLPAAAAPPPYAPGAGQPRPAAANVLARFGDRPADIAAAAAARAAAAEAYNENPVPSRAAPPPPAYTFGDYLDRINAGMPPAAAAAAVGYPAPPAAPPGARPPTNAFNDENPVYVPRPAAPPAAPAAPLWQPRGSFARTGSYDGLLIIREGRNRGEWRVTATGRLDDFGVPERWIEVRDIEGDWSGLFFFRQIGTDELRINVSGRTVSYVGDYADYQQGGRKTYRRREGGNRRKTYRRRVNRHISTRKSNK